MLQNIVAIQVLRDLEILKQASLQKLTERCRSEIAALWDNCFYSKEQRHLFSPAYDEEYTEELLNQHEEELTRLHVWILLWNFPPFAFYLKSIPVIQFIGRLIMKSTKWCSRMYENGNHSSIECWSWSQKERMWTGKPTKDYLPVQQVAGRLRYMNMLPTTLLISVFPQML